MPFSEFVYHIRQLSPLECLDHAYHPSACATAWGKLIYGKRYRESLFATPKPKKRLSCFLWTEEVVGRLARVMEASPEIVEGIVATIQGAFHEHHRRAN